jgi:hypothetical protein
MLPYSVEILLFDDENLCRFEDETGLCFLLPARVFPLIVLRIRLLTDASVRCGRLINDGETFHRFFRGQKPSDNCFLSNGNEGERLCGTWKGLTSVFIFAEGSLHRVFYSNRKVYVRLRKERKNTIVSEFPFAR